LAEPGRAGAGVGQRDLPALVADRRLALEDLAHDLDVVTQAPVRLAPRLAVPALDDLWAGHAEAGDHPPTAGERVDGHALHRAHRRRAPGELHDPGAETDALGLRGDPGERGDRVGPVRLG